MRESRTSGFVRGAHSNMCPYRDVRQEAGVIQWIVALRAFPLLHEDVPVAYC